MAQTTNPNSEECGLPAQGAILSSVSYTLIADCTQTGDISLNPGVSLTINGGGFTIRGSNAFSIVVSHANTTLNLNNVTFDNESNANATIVSVAASATLALTNVSFRGGSDGVALNVAGSVSATLTKVLFENNRLAAWGTGGNAPGLLIKGSATVTMNDAVFRNHRVGGGAIVVQGSASLTATGCLSFSGNIPYDVVGSWTDGRRGACTAKDKVGNGDSATIAAPAILPCGLPEPGSLDRSATYTLRFDCDLGASGSNVEWRIAQDASISIQGNGHTLRGGSGSNYMEVWQGGGGSLTIENLVVEHVTFYPFGAVTVRNSAFRSNPYLVFYVLGTVNISNSVFENLAGSSKSANALLTWSPYGAGHATFTNTIFRNNVSAGTGPVLNTFGAGTITLNGCISFENNAPSNYPAGANVTDDSSGPCAATENIGPPEPVSNVVVQPRHEDAAAATVHEKDCFQRLGEIGLICRRRDAQGTLEIWSIDENSEGEFVTAFTPAEVAALRSAVMFESSPDGRTACRVIGSDCVVRNSHGDDPRVTSADCIADELAASGGELGPYRHLAISMGPNPEGKTYTVVMNNSGWGSVIGTVDTITGLPGVPRKAVQASEPATTTTEQAQYAQPVHRQPARADGSIIHVIQPGDTVWQIGIAYDIHPSKIIALNQLDQLKNRGGLIFPGQRLIVRDG